MNIVCNYRKRVDNTQWGEVETSKIKQKITLGLLENKSNKNSDLHFVDV